MSTWQVKDEPLSPPPEPELPEYDDESDYDDGNNNDYNQTIQKPVLIFEYLRKTRRLYAGLDYMYEYQSMRLDDQNSRYYCMLCDKAIETADIAQHSTSYMHLFRYVKMEMPNEYDRLKQINSVEDRVKIVNAIVSFQKRVNGGRFPAPTVKLVPEIDACFDHLLRIPTSDVAIPDGDILKKLNDEEIINDTNRQRMENETIFTSIKRSSSSEFSSSSAPIQPINFVAHSSENQTKRNENNLVTQLQTISLTNIKSEPTEQAIESGRKHKLQTDPADTHDQSSSITEANLKRPKLDDDAYHAEMRTLIEQLMADPSTKLKFGQIVSINKYINDCKHLMSEKKFSKIEKELISVMQNRQYTND